MKKKLLIVQFILILLVESNLCAQEKFEDLKKRGSPFEQIILGAAFRHSVDPHLLWTIAYLESRFKPEAISYKNGRPCALGLMQFIPSTAQEYGLKNPYDPQEAVDAAARHVRRLVNRFDGRADLVLAAYNAGEGTVEAYRDGRRLVLKDGRIINPRPVRTGGVPPYTETQAYIARGRFIYQTISRHQLFPPPSQSPGFESSREGQVGTSIYTSNLGSRIEGIATQSNGSRSREGHRTLSFYAK